MITVHLDLFELRIRREVAKKESTLTRTKGDEETGQLRSVEDRLECPPVVEVYHAARGVCRTHYNTRRHAKHCGSAHKQNDVLWI